MFINKHMKDKKIFDLRIPLSDDLQPSLDEMRQFLDSLKDEHGTRKHRDDFTYYLRDLKAVEDFQSVIQPDIGGHSLDEQKLLGVLCHSQFFNHSLKYVIEQYKFHFSRLRVLDFKKPQAFIRAVQEEINSLNPKKRGDREKIAGLQARIDKRNEDIEALEKSRIDLTLELKGIALYVRDNLVRIQRLCESAIAMLYNVSLANKMAHEMIEDIKDQFKGELREQMLLGPVSIQEAQKKKDDFLLHSEELSRLVLQDRHSLRILYEQIRDHVRKFAIKFDAPVRQIEAKKGLHFDEEREALENIEEDLISLISDYRFIVKKTGQITHKDEHESLMMEKRKERMYYLLDFLQENADEKGGPAQPVPMPENASDDPHFHATQ
jgi:hypothetical protein